MSAILTGAALQRGPKRMRARLVMVAITDNADDYGFACVAIETIAEKALCDKRTVIRVVAELEAEGWMQVRRRAVSGRSNLYFVNLAKLEVTPSERSRMSEWHRRFLGADQPPKTAKPRDRMSPETLQVGDSATAAKVSGDMVSPVETLAELVCAKLPEADISGDNSQGVQVTFSGGSGDISGFPNKKNVLTFRNVTTPLPPSARGNGEAGFVEDADLIAAQHVCRECNLADTRTLGAVQRAIGNFRLRSDAEPQQVAEMMIAAYREWMEWGQSLRFRWKPARFFSDGHWLNSETWPLQQQVVDRMARAGRL